MKNTLVIFLSLILFSCSGEKKADIPKDVLTEEKMAKVMTDIHLLEASMKWRRS
ncbi:MAG TPA: hypothetical protein VLB84_10540 [Bacteroidia bacterium]|nr:hypothetical protein [Bacteroidia bacterium]